MKANAEDLSIDHKWQSRKVKSLHQSTFFVFSTHYGTSKSRGTRCLTHRRDNQVTVSQPERMGLIEIKMWFNSIFFIERGKMA